MDNKEWCPSDQTSIDTWIATRGFTHASRFGGVSGSDLVFAEDDEPESGETAPDLSPWRVLVVDDDPGVHEVTALSLRSARIGGRPLSLMHAYSAAEALALINERQALDIVLLDVVMETHTAGLNLVRTLREEADRGDLKIVLRTGQPGRFSEQRVRQSYAIDGYIQKSLQTRSMLLDIMAQVLLGPPSTKAS